MNQYLQGMSIIFVVEDTSCDNLTRVGESREAISKRIAHFVLCCLKDFFGAGSGV